MLRKIFGYFLFILSFNLTADEDTPYYQASIGGDPNSYVDGCVSVVSGSLVLQAPKIIVQGKEPIEITKRYVSLLNDYILTPTNRRRQFVGWSNMDHLLAEARTPVGKIEYGQIGPIWIEFTDPSGIKLMFSEPKMGEKTDWLTLDTTGFKRGISNTLSGEMGAKHNLINTKAIRLDPKRVKLIMPDGEERLYKFVDDYENRHSGAQLGYTLQWVKRPNGNKVIYSYEVDDVVKEIKTTNHDETEVYAWAKFHYSNPREANDFRRIKNPDYTITTSDHQKIEFKHNKIIRKDKYTSNKVQFLLKEISSDTFSVKYEYLVNYTDFPPLLKSVTSEEGRTTYFDYYLVRHNDKENPKKLWKAKCKNNHVKAIKKPVGENQTLEITYSLDYNIAETDEELNETIVKDAYGNKTSYWFNNELKLTRIGRFLKEDDFLFSERFSWEKMHDLTSSLLHTKTFFGKDMQPLFTKTYSYDEKGNILCEKTFGNISGNCPSILLDNHLPIDNGVNNTSVLSSFTKDPRNLLEKVTLQNELSIHYSYLPNTNLLKSELTKHDSKIYQRKFYEYDSSKTLVKIIEDDGSGEEITDLSGACTRKITSIVPKKSFPFIGMPEQILYKYLDFSTNTEKLDKRITLSYDKYGNIVAKSIFDSENKKRYILRFDYNKRNDLISETDPLGREATYAYDLDHNKIYEKDFTGRETKYSYDLCNRLTEKETYLGSSPHYTTKYFYNKKNHLIKQIDCRGNCIDFKVDLWGNVIETKETAILTKDGLKSPITHIEYDECFNPIKTISPLGYITTTTFNVYNNPISTIYPNNSFETCRYNANQTLKSHTDKEGITTKYEYDPLNRKTVTSIISKDNKLIKNETYKYEGLNLIEKIDFMGNRTKYSYDGLGRKTEETFLHDKEETILYSYDPMGYIEKETYIGEHPLTVEYKRDLLGQILELRKKDNNNLFAIEKYTYDSSGNKTSSTRIVDGKEAIETFSYDLFDRLIKHTDPLGNTTVITYDDFYVDSHGRKGIKKTEINPLRQCTITILDGNQRVLSIEKTQEQ